jgi:transposase
MEQLGPVQERATVEVDSIPDLSGPQGDKPTKPEELYADRAYDSEPHREALRERGIEPKIPKRRTEHGSGLGIYRWVVERTNSWLHGFLWVPKTSSADRIDAKRACERRLAERRRTRPGREFCLVPMEIVIRIRSSFSRPDAHYHRCDDLPCDGRRGGYAARV